MKTENALERHIALEGCYNLRDTGGYFTADGRTTRWRTLLRADALHRLSPESPATLLALPVKIIIDLRRDEELAAAPNVFASSLEVAYYHLPLISDRIESSLDLQALSDLRIMYRFMLDNSGHRIREVVELIAAEAELPVVVHCMGGKDRTGLIVALLLSLAGVDDETIAADYAPSHDNLTPLFAEMRAQVAQAGGNVDQFEKLLVSPPEYMLETLAYLKEKYGSAESYLLGLGLSKAQVALLKEKLVA